VLYERGAFTALDTPNTANALAIFALGLPAFVLIKVFSPAYFAREDTKTPMRYAVISLTANTLGSIALFFLFRHLGMMPHLGIAVATTLGGWMNATMLWLGLRRLKHFTIDARLRKSLPLILLSSVIMGLALLAGAHLLSPWLGAQHSFVVRAGALGLLIAFGMVVYFAVAHISGAFRFGGLKAAMRRGGS
jgi:putative peptidoglycan lipid II flippase